MFKDFMERGFREKELKKTMKQVEKMDRTNSLNLTLFHLF